MKRKPWMDKVGDHASCKRCGAKSQWVQGTNIESFRWPSYWKWWRRFKQTHAHCVNMNKGL